MGLWLHQEPTIKEIIASRDKLRGEVEHNFYWKGQVNCDYVRDNTILKGKAFDAMRQRFSQCECSLARDYVRYCALLKDAVTAHAQLASTLFFDDYGTRWFLDEIIAEIQSILRQISEIDSQLTSLARSIWQLSQDMSLPNLTNAFRAAANDYFQNITGLKVVLLLKRTYLMSRLKKLEARKTKMLNYNNHATVVAAYNLAMELGRAIAADVSRLRHQSYNVATGAKEFIIPKGFGKERGIFWSKWDEIQKAKEKYWTKEDIKRFLKEVNPKYYTGLLNFDDRDEHNCMFTAFALYLRLNNIDPESVAPLWKSDGNERPLFIYEIIENYASYIPDEGGTPGNFASSIRAALRRHGQGANALLNIRWNPDGKSGHELNVYFDGVNYYVLDSQNNSQESLSDYISKHGKSIKSWSMSPIYTPTNPYNDKDPFEAMPYYDSIDSITVTA